MYAEINANSESVVNERKLASAVRSYAFLRERFDEVDVREDEDFQREYRKFWALNAARRGQQWIDRYFALLEKLRGQRGVSLEMVVRELRFSTPTESGRGSLQFSFATKLLHMLDPSQPIYDGLIASFYFFAPPSSRRRFEYRLRDFMGFHGFLRSDYSRVLAERKLATAIQMFRSIHPLAVKFSDEKIIDFLIWTYVRVLRSGVQREGRLLYT